MATTFLQVKNRATSTLAADITDVATSLTVAAGGGANFPAVYPFHITIDNEILSCTNRATDTLTVVRAQQGTTGVAHLAAVVVSLNITAQNVSDLNTAVNAIENAKGAASGLASLNASSLVVQNPATSYIPAAEKAAASGVASLNASSLVVQNPATSYIPSAEKAAASGVASLDASSKVVQDPVTSYIPLAQKAAASGVASLSAASLVVQKPADRLSKANFEITLNKLLKGAGAGADPTEIDVPSADFFDKFREFIPWVSLDGFSVGGDTGYLVSVKGTQLFVRTTNILDNDAFCGTLNLWYALLDAGKLITFEFIITDPYDITNVNTWIRMSATIADPPSEITDHFGWKIINADLYASNANGTTQTITDTTVDLATGHQRTRLNIVLNPGTDCKFYVNNVLKVTHTTNLPVTTEYYFHVHVRAKTAGAKGITIGRVLIEKEYA